jgi:hypothetical protein
VPLIALKSIKTTTRQRLVGLQNEVLADWDPPPISYFKVNFDVGIRPSFAVVATTLQYHIGNFLAVKNMKLHAPLWMSYWVKSMLPFWSLWLVVSMVCPFLIIEGDSLLITLP